MDHDTGIVLIFVIFFALLIVGILLVFIKSRGRRRGDGYNIDDVLRRHKSWMHDLNEDESDPANPSSPLWRERHQHHEH